MKRKHILATPGEAGAYELGGPDNSGLDQIADYAQQLGRETGDREVYFEIFWPWETEVHQTWDAVRVDLDKLDKWDGKTPEGDVSETWWIETLPPYADLTQEQRDALGIEGYNA